MSKITFGDNNSSEDEKVDEQDLSKYTVIDADHLDEDPIVKGQEFCVFSFMSPEGIMNCNVRAVKFRGAYPTMEKAEERAKELEKIDKYFKIYIGESGKWLDFDPPSSKVEREMSSNKDHQKILDVQRKQRMDKINTLAGKHKEMIDKKEKGKAERITESTKAGAANDANEKQRNAKQNPRLSSLEKTKERLRKRIEEKQKVSTDIPEVINIDNKIKVVNKVSDVSTDTKLSEVDKNIEKIKELMNARRANKD